jgi:hypothetical protein
MVGGFTVSVAVRVWPSDVAEIVTVRTAGTTFVVIVTGIELPDATTDAGNVAVVGSLLVNVIGMFADDGTSAFN